MSTTRILTGNRSATGPTVAVAGCLLAAGLGACSEPAAPADRAGSDTLVLHLATSDGEGTDPATIHGPLKFVQALEEVSGGRLKVELEFDYGAAAPDAETQVVEAIESGEVDGGWPATRAFGRAGIEGLGPVEAPMLIASEQAVDELVSGDLADDVLAVVDGSGVKGLGLMAAPLRRPVSASEPLLAPDDWEGVRFRVYNSDVQAAAVEALGGRPVVMTHGWTEALRVGELDGGEADVVTSNLPADVAHITGNVVLWPKVHVTTFNAEMFESLTDQQQEWIQEAADLARDASVAAPYDESADLLFYCNRGTAVHLASAADISAMREKVAPVLDDLREDPATSELMAAVESLAERYPGTDMPSPAGGCDGEASAPDDGLPAEAPPIPDGTYRTEITIADTAEVGNGPGWSGAWTLTIDEGTYAYTCRPVEAPGNDCGNAISEDVLEAGHLRGDNDQVWFVGDGDVTAELTGCTWPAEHGETDCLVLEPYGAVWRLDGDELVFPKALGPKPFFHLSLRPWLRVDG